VRGSVDLCQRCREEREHCGTAVKYTRRDPLLLQGCEVGVREEKTGTRKRAEGRGVKLISPRRGGRGEKIASVRRDARSRRCQWGGWGCNAICTWECGELYEESFVSVLNEGKELEESGRIAS